MFSSKFLINVGYRLIFFLETLILNKNFIFFEIMNIFSIYFYPNEKFFGK